jgi:hypothetical protein
VRGQVQEVRAHLLDIMPAWPLLSLLADRGSVSCRVAVMD